MFVGNSRRSSPSQTDMDVMWRIISFIILLSFNQTINPQIAAARQSLEGTRWRDCLMDAHAAVRRGHYASALANVDEASAHWPKVWGCGNAAAACAYERDMLRAAAFEGLGRTNEAARIYWSACGGLASVHEADTRLVNMYWAARQLPAMHSILDEMDRRYAAYCRELLGARFDAARDCRHPRASEMRKAIALKQAGSARNWSRLLAALRQGYGRPAGFAPHEWTGSWEPIEAARQLATRPAETVPLVLQDLAKRDGPATAPPTWHDLALALAADPSSIAALRQRASKLPVNEVPQPDLAVDPAAAGFVVIVAQAGAAGEELLAELVTAPATPASLRRALGARANGQLTTDLQRIPVPVMPSKFDLPLTPNEALKDAESPNG